MEHGDFSPAGRTSRWTLRAGLILVAVAAGIVGLAVVLRFRPPSIHGEKAYTPPAVRMGDAVEYARSAPGSEHTVYVPVYSHIYHRGGRAFLLEATLSVRNTDRSESITLSAVDFYHASGRLLQRRLERPLRLPPLATAEFLVEEKDESGGAGASFLVTWSSNVAVSEPVVEAVMIGTAGSQGISFLSPGRPVDRPGAVGDPPQP